MSREARLERLARIVGGVVRQAVADAGAPGIVLLDADSPEGGLARRWCAEALGTERVWFDEAAWPAGALTAHPANKTVLLLSPSPTAALLPLGDLYASEVRQLAGDWSGPATVRSLAAAAGDVASIDAALRRWAEERRGLEEAFDEQPELLRLLRAHRFTRWRGGLVPKLGGRTLGIDLWD